MHSPTHLPAPRLLNVLPAGSQRWGQELPGSPEAGLAFARSWGDRGEAEGKASLLSAHLLPHQPLLQGMGTSPPWPHFGMQWNGDPGQGALLQPLLLPSRTRNGWGHHRSIPWTGHLGPLPAHPSTVCLLPSSRSTLAAEDKEERAEKMGRMKQHFWGRFSHPGWAKP